MDEADWKKRYHNLEKAYRKLEALCKRLSEKVSALEEENKALKERLNTNSSNSSKPPSQDPFRPNRKTKPSGKQRGGQPGHPGHKRQLYPEADLTANTDLKPTTCPSCQSAQFDAIPISIECRQVVELPPIQAEVTQYNIHTCRCGHCGKRSPSRSPERIWTTPYGISHIAEW